MRKTALGNWVWRVLHGTGVVWTEWGGAGGGGDGGGGDIVSYFFFDIRICRHLAFLVNYDAKLKVG